MGSTILALLAALGKPIAEAFFSAFGRAVSDMLAAWRREQLAEDKGRLTAERDQARAGEIANARLAIGAAKRVEPEEALGRLDKGDA